MVAIRAQRAINKKTNTAFHKVGLGNIGANLPFYSADKNLGTFSDIEQYDLPLRQIDAIKIDVQGYEPEVLAGLAEHTENIPTNSVV